MEHNLEKHIVKASFECIETNQYALCDLGDPG